MDSPNDSKASFLWATWLIAVVAAAGSLWLSIGMGLKACPLCLYQRAFVLSVAVVLTIGGLTGQFREERSVLAVLCLPMALAGLGVAAFHVYLEFSGKLECPSGILEVGTAPQQSFAILSALVQALLVQGSREVRVGHYSAFALLPAAILGGLIAYASIASAPPLPKAPDRAYETPLDTCRPPFRNPG
jgi:disulfide bond formation protein DsbB